MFDIHIYLRTYIHMYIQTYALIYTYLHTCIHKYTHTFRRSKILLKRQNDVEKIVNIQNEQNMKDIRNYYNVNIREIAYTSYMFIITL